MRKMGGGAPGPAACHTPMGGGYLMTPASR